MPQSLQKKSATVPGGVVPWWVGGSHWLWERPLPFVGTTVLLNVAINLGSSLLLAPTTGLLIPQATPLGLLLLWVRTHGVLALWVVSVSGMVFLFIWLASRWPSPPALVQPQEESRERPVYRLLVPEQAHVVSVQRSEGPVTPPSAPAPPGTVWMVPYARNPFFTGREALLQQLYTRLQGTNKAALSQPQAINGLGGVGKTQLAIEYAHRYWQEYQVVLWARADTTEALDASYSEIARDSSCRSRRHRSKR